MKIKYLGTAAFEGVPALFCKCEVCRTSRKLGGRNIRSRSQALINDELLIDFNADTCAHYHKYGFDFESLCGCLITHAHSDHLYPDDVAAAGEVYSHGHRALEFYAARVGCDKLRPTIDTVGDGAKLTLIEAGKRFSLADGRYSVLPLCANHDQNSGCVFYSIECDGKRLLYAHDTGVFFDDVWELLKTERHFDLISLDCTGCLGLNGEWRDGHMSLKTNIETVERMRALNLIDNGTRIVLDHFSHNGGQTYDEMQSATRAYGFTVAYDGMEIEF